jgi:hypothetical protein
LTAHNCQSDIAIDISQILDRLTAFQAPFVVQSSLICVCASFPPLFQDLFPAFVSHICESFQFEGSRIAFLALSRIFQTRPELTSDVLNHPLFDTLICEQDRFLRMDSFLRFLMHFVVIPEIRTHLIVRIHWRSLLNGPNDVFLPLVNPIADLFDLSVPEVLDCRADWTSFTRTLVQLLVGGLAVEKLAAIRCVGHLCRSTAFVGLVATTEFANAFVALLESDDRAFQTSSLHFLEEAVQAAIGRPNTFAKLFRVLFDANVPDALAEVEWDEADGLSAHSASVAVTNWSDGDVCEIDELSSTSGSACSVYSFTEQ